MKRVVYLSMCMLHAHALSHTHVVAKQRLALASTRTISVHMAAPSDLGSVFDVGSMFDLGSILADPLSSPLALVPAAAVAASAAKFLLEKVLLPILLKDSYLKDSIPSTRYKLGKRLGKGSYGSVYRGESDSGQEVVVKEINLNADPNARDFAVAELYMNQKLKTVGAQNKCAAQFIGHFNSLGGDPYFSLVFKDEGDITLMDALKDRSFPASVAEYLKMDGKPDAMVIRRIASQVFGNLAALHDWNIVHRDVKGENLLLCESDNRFKFIDFGVACDLATLTNYRQDLQPFDPSYCPPEAPPLDRGGQGGIILSSGGRFDVFSAGLLVAQMAFPPMRSDQGIKRFKEQLAGVEYDLEAWRQSSEGVRTFEAGFEFLDESGGWKLLKECLQEDPKKRISAAAAASSGFCRA